MKFAFNSGARMDTQKGENVYGSRNQINSRASETKAPYQND